MKEKLPVAVSCSKRPSSDVLGLCVKPSETERSAMEMARLTACVTGNTLVCSAFIGLFPRCLKTKIRVSVAQRINKNLSGFRFDRWKLGSALGAGAAPGVLSSDVQEVSELTAGRCDRSSWRLFILKKQIPMCSYSTSNFKKHFSETPCALRLNRSQKPGNSAADDEVSFWVVTVCKSTVLTPSSLTDTAWKPPKFSSAVSGTGPRQRFCISALSSLRLRVVIGDFGLNSKQYFWYEKVHFSVSGHILKAGIGQYFTISKREEMMTALIRPSVCAVSALTVSTLNWWFHLRLCAGLDFTALCKESVRPSLRREAVTFSLRL